jgi:hypothetical protein
LEIDERPTTDNSQKHLLLFYLSLSLIEEERIDYVFFFYYKTLEPKRLN